jgi:hypothetical protein
MWSTKPRAVFRGLSRTLAEGYRYVAAGCLAALLLMPAPALAWGKLGHRAASRLAESRLKPQALAAVRDLLEPGETLADASTWADEVRRARPRTARWHYVNVPITEPAYTEAFCPQGGCVVTAVEASRRVLSDRDAPFEARREALRFLIHFVQDLHQPLHVGDRGDKGGNLLQVRFFSTGSNLHKVWDVGLLEHAYRDELSLFADLTELAGAVDQVSHKGGPEDWAAESLTAARNAYLDPDSGEPLVPGSLLGMAYQQANLPVARARLAHAGVRLADLLNDVFATN